MKRLIATFVAISFIFLATGCGQSGPLYIPGNPSRIEAPSEAPAETAEEKEEENDDDKE
jgi:predicted small lipoprotein YifL